MKKNQQGSILLAALVFIVVFGLGAAGYFVYQSNAKSDGKSTSTVSSSTSKTTKCDTNKCFQEKFIKCEPASLSQNGITSQGGKSYYEIISGDTGNCRMLYKTDKDNLDLICTYQETNTYNTGEDNEFELAAAKNENEIGFGKETNCTGPKVEKLKQMKPVTNGN